MAAPVALKRVPRDPGWNEVFECATLELFEMMASGGSAALPHHPNERR